MKILFYSILPFILASSQVFAQTPPDTTRKLEVVKDRMLNMPLLGKHVYTFNYNSLSQFYPNRENPHIGYQSPITGNEVILGNLEPVLTLNVFNDMERKFRQEKKLGMSYYFAFRPQFRLYRKRSKPVPMPSYRVFMGFRHMLRLSEKHYVGYGLESGHYSNGQSGCALGNNVVDQSDACDSVYALLTDNSELSELINRFTGNYSTNLTELSGNYRYIADLDEFDRPKEIHSFSLGFQFYHQRLFGFIPAGGFYPRDLPIYGRCRFLFSYGYTYQWRSGYRIVVSEDIEIIQGAHASVNPFRSVTTGTVFLPRNIGFFVSYTYGHDDYNLRFVDAGHQFCVGFVWDMFPPRDTNEDE